MKKTENYQNMFECQKLNEKNLVIQYIQDFTINY